MEREGFFCPITFAVMQDPVIDPVDDNLNPEGNSYERAAIEGWLAIHHTSPITRTPLTVEQLAPNRALRDVIQEELRKSEEAGDTQWYQSKQQNKTPVNPEQQSANSGQESSASQQTGTQQTGAQQDNQADNSQANAVAAAQAKAEDVLFHVTSTPANGDQAYVHVSVVPGQGVSRSPIDVCCVVDISGSMGCEATTKTSGKEEKHGLSLLDIVKHAVKTVVESLEASDKFALVVFSTTARVVFPLTAISPDTKTRIFTQIDKLEPEDTTNLWDGLRQGLEILKKSVPGRVSALLMLTDGLPNVTPPRGELAMLKKYKDENKQLNTTINTFGFGYSIDTPLLVSLAAEGNGSHSFIPDASFVGTTFVNTLSNLMVTMGTNVTLSIEPQQGAKVHRVLGAYDTQITSWGAQVGVCSLQYGQSKDLVIELKLPADLPANSNVATVTLRYELAKTGQVVEATASTPLGSAVGDDVTVHRARLDFVSSIPVLLSLVQKGQETAAELAGLERRVGECEDPRAKALLQDISGQVREAIITSPENYFQRWGRHYLPSLARAHLLQQSNNFKDPGIQVYGGQLFQRKRDEIDDIFLKLPPPKPSVRRFSAAAGGKAPPAPIQNMAVYHNAYGGCFAGECLVLMASGVQKRVCDLVKGDVVQTPTGPAGVLCAIKFHSSAGKDDLVVFPGGLRITPYHPVRMEGKWHFPASLFPWQRDTPIDAVYNFVLQEGHIMNIQGVECVTLGHGFTDDEVITHPYFGTSRVVDDLKSMKGWQQGLVEFFPASCEGGKCTVRDKDGLVSGFAPSVAREV